MITRWLGAAEWQRIQRTIPILCVDVLPVQCRPESDSLVTAVGLIRRETPHQGRRWCLVGGRLWRDEILADAVARQLHDTLGRQIEFDLEPGIQPVYVAEYFTAPREVGGVDPRQHAVGLSYCVAVEGIIEPQGEALAFQWFDPTRLPRPDEFGFNQDRVVASCLARLNVREPTIEGSHQ